MKPRKESVIDRARSHARAPTRLIALPSIVACVFGLAGTTQAGGQYVQVKYPAATAADELQVAVTYTMWIPDGVPRLRGVIVHQHGAGTTASKEGSTAAYDLHWQALAKKWDCALLGPSYHVLHERNDLSPGSSQLWFDPRRGSEKAFLNALRDLGAKSNHPELEIVPWALWGHSGGGIWADVMNTMHPDRIAAMWLRSGSVAQFRTHDEFPQPQVPAAAYAVPIMLNPGVKEEATFKPNPKGKEKGPWYGNLATFHEYRAEGALVGFAPDPRTDHECGDSRYLAIPYLDACLALRLPDKGSTTQKLKPMDTSKAWLAPLIGKEATESAAFNGELKESVWLPNQAVAKAWMEYVKTGSRQRHDSSAGARRRESLAQRRKRRGRRGDRLDGRGRSRKRYRRLHRVAGRARIGEAAEDAGRQIRDGLCFNPLTYHDTPARCTETEYFDCKPSNPAPGTATKIITVNSASA